MRFLAGLLVFLVLPAWCATSALLFRKAFGGSGNESVAAIATDPSGYVVFAGSTSSYDYPVTNGTSNTATHFAVTLDAGRTWSPLSNLPSGTPISLAVDTRTPSTWYAGGTTGIFKSTDAGATWTATGSTGLSNCVFVAPVCGATALAINPAQQSIVYALTSNGIVKTADSGASWNPVTPPVQGQNPLAYLGMDPLHPDHLFTAVAGMDFRSFDGGQSWTQYTPPLLDPNSHCSSWASPVAFDTRSPNTVYLVDHCDLFRSTDGGIYWSAISTPFTIAYAVVADPSQAGKLFVLSFDGLYGTTDGGASWSLLLPYTQGNPPPFVAFDPAQPPVVLAGAARSQDGGSTWTPLASGTAAKYRGLRSADAGTRHRSHLRSAGSVRDQGRFERRHSILHLSRRARRRRHIGHRHGSGRQHLRDRHHCVAGLPGDCGSASDRSGRNHHFFRYQI